MARRLIVDTGVLIVTERGARSLANVVSPDDDMASAEAHGRLLAHVHRSGTRRGAHDLLIAATAIATRRIILTTDQSARFQDLPGVDCIIID